MEVGSQLTEQFRTQDAADRTVVASGTSCLDQLDTLLERPATHPLEVIDPSSSA
ncbi:lactate utilization protein B/C [Halococcus salifodinae DSM 8989]|uniref:Lactate utilization protein B/C n=1 Tax=Halococcus salifodinae DSM 8989 TaxID=1227456 RepID=M0MTS5_9EURY|nr:lactate utilization protein B/C [Halococcus salifodinae DSM 8989]